MAVTEVGLHEKKIVDFWSLDRMRESLVDQAEMIGIAARDQSPLVEPLEEEFFGHLKELEAAVYEPDSTDVLSIEVPDTWTMRFASWKHLENGLAFDRKKSETQLIHRNGHFIVPLAAISAVDAKPFGYADQHAYEPQLDIQIRTGLDPVPTVLAREDKIPEPKGRWYRLPLADVKLRRLSPLEGE